MCGIFLALWCYTTHMQVKLPDDVMLEPDTTLASLAPVIRAGGAIPERSVAAPSSLSPT